MNTRFILVRDKALCPVSDLVTGVAFIVSGRIQWARGGSGPQVSKGRERSEERCSSREYKCVIAYGALSGVVDVFDDR